MLVNFDVGGQQGMNFSQEEDLLWIMDSMGKTSQLKHLKYGFISHKHVDYLQIFAMFLSAVWTLIFTAPILCRGFTSEQVM